MKKVMFRLLLLCLPLLSTVYVNAQNNERLYIQEFSFTPGGEMDYFTIAFENGAYSDYTAFQFDLILPPGLELAYYEGDPEIYISEDDDVYTARKDDHTVAYNVHPGFIRIICSSNTNKVIAKSGNLVDIYVTPSPYLKPGNIEVKLTDVKFARTTEEYGFKADELTLTGLTAESTSSLKVKISAANKYGTAILPFDVENIPTGLEVYSCNRINGESLVLQRQERIAAYTPYILYAPNGYEATLSGEVDAAKYNERLTDGYLTGTVVHTEIGGGNGYYVLQNKGEGSMFYKVGDTSFSIPAGRCWLTIPAGMQGSASFRLDGTTGVEEVKGENGEVKTIYDLQGRKVNAENGKQKGLYIVGGKKVILK